MKRLTGSVRTRRDKHAPPAHPLACPDCGQPPEPAHLRGTLGLVLAILPVELIVHAAVIQLELPLLLKVVLLTLAATALAIWSPSPRPPASSGGSSTRRNCAGTGS